MIAASQKTSTLASSSSNVPEIPGADLINRYNRAGPRYTSYPPAPYWTAPYSDNDYAEALAEAGARPASAQEGYSIYIHLPFCERRCRFCACNVVISRAHERGRTYIQQLADEMDLALAAMNTRGEIRPAITQMHWGGGTPTWLSAEELDELCVVVADRFNLLPDREQSVEVDPRVTSFEQLDVLRARGLNRVSMGVQDFDPDVQRAVNRIQTREQTAALIQHARSIGIEGVNVDLIYGLPHQNVESFGETVDSVLALNVDRVALYNFAWLPTSVRHHKAIDAKALPSADTRIELFRSAAARFTAAGYIMVGLDHFARKTDELADAMRDGTLQRNFMGYTTRGGTGSSLLSFGASSISRIGRDFAQNVKTTQEYEARLAAGRLPVHRGMRLSDDDLAREHIIQRLMCYGSIDLAEVERRFGIDVAGSLTHDARAQLEEFARDHLIEFSGTQLRVLALGRYFLRNIAMVFDAYLNAAPARGPAAPATGEEESDSALVQIRFSRTV
jgi:oxygen-independent coproporphyrinogen III oxidase